MRACATTTRCPRRPSRRPWNAYFRQAPPGRGSWAAASEGTSLDCWSQVPAHRRVPGRCGRIWGPTFWTLRRTLTLTSRSGQRGRDPVGDRRRPLRIGHRTDAIEALLVTGGDPLVLAHVVLPGRDNELLDETVGLSTVA